MIDKINNLGDVIRFSEELIEEGTNFHPDDDFTNYCNLHTGETSYTVEEELLRNRLMSECFEVCKVANANIYDITMEVFLKKTGLDQYIPLPSSIA